jgi:hypothetical protein
VGVGVRWVCGGRALCGRMGEWENGPRFYSVQRYSRTNTFLRRPALRASSPPKLEQPGAGKRRGSEEGAECIRHSRQIITFFAGTWILPLLGGKAGSVALSVRFLCVFASSFS